MEKLSNSELCIQVSASGAELCSIQCDGKEFLWQADPVFWGRHSPVLFPIVGRVWDDMYQCDGNTYKLSQHGFARDMDFQLVKKTDSELRYRLVDNEQTHQKFPYAFCLEVGYRIEGKKIEVIWQVENTGQQEMHFQIGAHPAFFYPKFDASTKERGFFKLGGKQQMEYILIGEKGCAVPQTRYPLYLTEGQLPITTETFDRDALILEDAQVNEVTLLSPLREPILKMTFDAPVVGLWSPPSKNAPFVCIEPWYGRCDRVGFTGEFKDRDWMQHLSPSEIFHGGYVIEILD